MRIASVSTIPGRLSSLLRVLERFQHQTLRPDLLIVIIAKEYPRLGLSYPDADRNTLETYLQTYPIPNIVMTTDVDIGPSVKLVVPLQHITSQQRAIDNDDVILIFDDDSVVYEKALELLWEAHRQNSNAVYGLMGVIEHGTSTAPQFVHGEFLPREMGAMNVDVLGGYRTVLYPVHLLLSNNPRPPHTNQMTLIEWVNLHVQKHQEKGLVAMHDDHIFAYYCRYRGIPTQVIHIPSPHGRLFYEPIDNTDGIFADANSHASYELIRQTVERGGQGPP